MMVIDNKFKIRDIVYLKTDEDQLKRMVTCIKIYDAGELIYVLSCGTTISDHYEYEITKTINYGIKKNE